MSDRFRALHESGCFVIPNPWDTGSARYLAGLGFEALATTSSGFAFSRGLPDGDVPLGEMIVHVREIVEATDLPVNADFLNAFADDPDEVTANVRGCVGTGVAGLSVEDMRSDRSLYDFGHALDRVRAARAAIDGIDPGVMLTARCEAFVVGHADPLGEACRRLEAFADVGADVLFAPGARDAEAIRAIVSAVAPKPVNVIATPSSSVEELEALGVRRISLASGLSRAAWGGFLRAARELAEGGTFAGLENAEPGGDLNQFFREERWRT
ncbi:MAG: isocitrate lyase/phosphoenolpyruvate mutase family protein [Actinomycetota bacterium]